MLDLGPNRHFYRSSPEFGPEKKLIPDVNDDDDSGVYSPPLWRTSPPRNQYRNLSPSSRAQAIARGQKELMEMVSKMPEGCYELSLKDIVEQSFVDPVKEESFADETRMMMKKKTEKKKVQQMSRSGSMDHNHNGGFLLKMVFPVSLGSTKKKNMMNKAKSKSNNGDSGREGRVSPRALLVDGASKAAENENEWWKKRFIIEAEESESGGLSSNSGSSKSSGSSTSRNSSTNSNAWHGGGGCWAFIFRKRGNKLAPQKQD